MNRVLIDATPLRHVYLAARRRRRRPRRIHHVAAVHHHAPSLLHVLGASWDLRISVAFFAVLIVAGVVARRVRPTTAMATERSAPLTSDPAAPAGAVLPVAVPQGAKPRQRRVPVSIGLMAVSTFVLPFSVVALELHTGKTAPDSAIAGAFVATIWLVLSLACGAVGLALPALRARQGRRDDAVALSALGVQVACLLTGLLSVALALQPLLTSGLHS